ncbi:hypothetical protein EZ428_16570 [Pedobacter frigiditerrae]|uniref:DNA alkylation repair enzyme n=1 Tax=Pedobacter frigiditerrae TaxID=2530452 RepID=A0A4R0MR01_9SPHI|nr:hypothetical protein [Pedobacter frigiditerrae]TCC89308.1 hypothetical protein EZ428_16570 [Pedobacter frigiditerrae]
MEKTKIIVELSKTLNKKEIGRFSSSSSNILFEVKDLIEISFHKNEQIAFRAAWILENVYIKNLERFMPQSTYFLSVFSSQNNLSCRRHYGKILALMTDRKAPLVIKELIRKYDTEKLVEIVFSWLIDEKITVAIKSHCLNILANLNSKHSWIKDELIQTMDYLVDKESVGFYSKVKQIRKQLESI